ncbi:calpain-A isoform X2 [Octopus sinensis]|uniref:Calpain-A isoform X2 n=1 Tax=Octopus sinensis TaxID=2607531 RepID=A0A6P7SWB0_9MOLL|nr:calpain-A isoform X2 [Octopus sinensis]
MFSQSFTKMFSGGDGGGSSIFNMGGGQFNIDFGDSGLGGFKIPIQLPGQKGGEGISIRLPGKGGGHNSVIGRSSRKQRENPFASMEQQNYDEIVKKCQEEGILFEDPEFPADNSSLFLEGGQRRTIEWKRPKEICEDPKFFVGGASRFDVKQGELGDCWLLAAVASLTIDQKLLFRVVPLGQNFQENYTGCFRFRFWHQGDWVDVVVDDRIPTSYGQLIYMHSADKNEFWSALLEKAYAKLNGCYEALKGGNSSEAMEDFTGGVTEMFDLRESQDKLFQIMLKAFQRSSLMGCSIDADPSQLEAKLSNGLICGHAYSITCCKFAEIPSYVEIETPRKKGKIPMVRIRNPWGESEWNGAWSDQSEEWKFISQAERNEIGLVYEDDGEFWMSFQDFVSNFQKLEICNLAPDSLDEDELNARSKKRWESTCESGSWVKRVSAGGCRNYLDTFWTNPQFKVSLTDPDDDDDDNMCTLLIAVLQKDRRKNKKQGIEMLTIGYMIYKLSDDAMGGIQDMNFFKYHPSCGKSASFINMREICGRHKLDPGNYVVVPSTFEPNCEGDFLVRVFTEKESTGGLLDEETGFDDNQLEMISICRLQAQPPQCSPSKGSSFVTERATSRQQGIAFQAIVPSHTARPAVVGPKPAEGEAAAAAGSQMTFNEATDEEKEQGEALRSKFMEIAGEDMEINSYELRDVLNTVFKSEFQFEGFGIEACRSMVAMHDGDMSGKLGFVEFKTLWKDLRRWKSVFKDFDADKSGNLNSHELRNALHSAGFRLSNNNFQALVMRYSNEDGSISFVDFIVCAIRLKSMLTSFATYDTGKTGVIALSANNFVQMTMYS